MAEPWQDELGRGAADPAKIIGALTSHDVDFMLIGGLAVIVHGHTRTTRDVDIIPAPGAANMRRLAAALQDLGAAAVDRHGNRLPFDLSHPESLAVGNYFLDTRAGGLDILNGARPDLHRYRRLRQGAIAIHHGEHAILVIGLDDLIAMKREAGRDKDLRDIAALTDVRRHGRSAEPGKR